MKKTFVLLLSLFLLLSTSHRLYAPIVIYATLNAPVISGGTVIVSGSASPPSSVWTLQQSSDLSSGIWLLTQQQPVFNGTSFSCTNTQDATQMFYQMKYGLNGPP
jgi:hypothetical protein